MKKHLFRNFTIFVIFLIPLIGISQELKWIYKIGSTNTDYGAGVALDNNQHVYDITNFTGVVGIVPNINLASRGQEDILIRKSNPNGIQQWIRQLAGKYQDLASDIITDNQNNVYIIGTFKDSLYLESTLVLTTLENTFAGFIIKLNTDGQFQWAKKIESVQTITPKSISIGAFDDIVVSGNFEGIANFPDSQVLTSKGGSDIFIYKLNKNTGSSIFLKQIGGLDQDFVSHQITDTENNIFITGDFRSRVDFNPDSGEFMLESKGLTDIFLLKLNASGGLSWAKSYGSINTDYGHSIAIDQEKNIILTGRFSATIGFGNTTQVLQSKGGTDIFLLKLNNEGLTQWVHGFGDLNNDAPSHVVVNSTGVILLSGTFRNKVDFDPSVLANSSDSNGGADIFVAWYNQDGTYNDHFAIGGIANEQISKFVVKSNGEMILSGGYGAIVDFDPRPVSELNIFSSGGLDAFMINIFICINPYIKELRVAKSEICYGETILIQIAEGYLNGATQWSWQRDNCNNPITFNAGPFLVTPLQNSTSFFVKGWGGCIISDECKRIDIKVYKDTLRYQFYDLCEGDTIKVGNHKYASAGVYVDSLTSVSGCDSTIVTEINLNKRYTSTDYYQICTGDTVKVGNSIYTFSGTYTNIFQTILGCDSIVISNVSVKPTQVDQINSTICEGQSIKIGNITYTSGGTYIQESDNPNGCKNLQIINISVIKKDVNLQKTICFGDSVKVGNHVYYNTGVYKDTLISTLGCDSIITLSLIIIPQTSTTVYQQICEGDSVVIGSNIYKTSGNYTDILKNYAGCDSTIFSEVVVIPKIPPVAKNFTICEGDSIKVGLNIYKSQGVYSDTLRSYHGCDSIVTTSLIVSLKNYSFTESICEGDTLNFANTKLTAPGSYAFPFKNSLGCDSIVMILLVVKQKSHQSFNHLICPGDSVLVKGFFYKTPQNLSFKYISANGCDSTESYQIAYNHVTTMRNITMCKGDAFTFNGQTFTNPGSYPVILKKTDGCDSIIQLNINVNPSYTVDTIFEICKGGSVTVGTSTFLNPGKYIENLKTIKGCDSIIRFEVRVTNFIPAIFLVRDTLIAYTLDGATYQWYDCTSNNNRIPYLGATGTSFPLFKSGKFALSITFKGCTYFSDCLDFIRSSLDELPKNIAAVYPNPFREQVKIYVERNLKLQISDVQGNIIGDHDLRQGINELEIGQLAPGIYIFKLSDLSGKLYIKAIKF